MLQWKVFSSDSTDLKKSWIPNDTYPSLKQGEVVSLSLISKGGDKFADDIIIDGSDNQNEVIPFRKKLNAIAALYWHEKEGRYGGGYYAERRFDGKEDFFIEEELTKCFKDNSVQYQFDKNPIDRSISHDSDLLTFAWFENGNHELFTLLTDSY